MRTLILVCVVALVVACGIAYAVGLIAVATDQPEGQYIVTLTVNTDMLHHHAGAATPTATPNDDSLDVKGKITAVRPEQNEIVVAEGVKDWTFQLAKNAKVFINDRESNLAQLQAGDDVEVTFDRLGEQMLANVIHSTRK